MFGHLKHISPKTKILFFAILLILLPSAVLSYLGVQSVREKAENLRTNYRGSINLVRDKIEHEFIIRQDALRSSLSELVLKPDRPEELKSRLADLTARNPFIRYAFFINVDWGVISITVSSGWWKGKRPSELFTLSSNADFQAAEVSEFVNKDFSEALQLYKNAMTNLTSPAGQALLLSRIGRCYFKMEKYREGIDAYRRMLELPIEALRLGTPPYSVVALSQIAEGHGALHEDAQRGASLVRLYELLLNNPWDIEGGEYSYYLKSASEEIEDYLTSQPDDSIAKQKFMGLKERGKNLNDEIQFVEFVRQTVGPQIQSYLARGGSASEVQPQNISEHLGDSTLQVGFVKLPATFQQSGLVAFGYQIDEKYVVSELLPGILSKVDLGRDVAVGILNEKQEAEYLQQELPISKYLIAENFSQLFPSWKVALFHPEGKTIEELVGREKETYLVLFLGIILVMLIGVVVTARAASHELEVSRLKSEFVSSVSHELKTPLALIRMFGETLETGLVTDEAKRQEFYRIIRKESERLTHLINNVLDFSKMDAGSKEYTFEGADVVEIVRSTLEAYKFHVRDLGFEMVEELPAEPIIARVDKDAISQALLNLLSNATRYSDEEKYVRVEVREDNGWVLISVEDHGVGIPKEDLKKIFDKFYRAGTQKTRETRGSGLGLTLVKHIVEAHGGSIEVESEVGRGSRFTIRIPLKGENSS